jgi:LuxR family maltose regulon positive regulatory protein
MEQLDESQGCKLTLVSAPAGFGKSTLVSAWIQHNKSSSFAWLSLDDGDNDQKRFSRYFIAALQSIIKDLGAEVLNSLQSQKDLKVEAVLTILLNEISDFPDDLTLILDDYHLIDSPEIDQIISFLLEGLPENMGFVIITRVDPNLPLSRMRSLGEMVEIRARDLRFTLDETNHFLNQTIGLDLSAEDVLALETRTEGWIVGLQMAALSMKGRSDPSEFISTFTGSNRFILDYLVEEVLNRQPDDIQDFLLRTSILERMTPTLCDAVLDRDDSQEILNKLEQSNLFLIALDDERVWYRYHQLFADLLRDRLKGSKPELEITLQARASKWFKGDGAIIEAINYALASNDVEQVAHLVAGNILVLMEHGELRTLGRQLDGLPGEELKSQPWLGVARAWVSAFSNQLDEVEPLLEGVESLIAKDKQTADNRPIAGYVAAARVQVASVRGQFEGAIEYALEALDKIPADDLMARSWVSVALALNHSRNGNIKAADQALAEALSASRATGDSHVAVLTLCTLAVVRRERGLLHSAEEILQEALGLTRTYANRVGRLLPVGGYAHITLATVLYEWNDLEAALSQAQQGIELSQQWREPELLVGTYLHLARILSAIGDEEGMYDAIHQGLQIASGLSPWYVDRWAPVAALLRLRQGDIKGADRWASKLSGLSADSEAKALTGSASLVMARIQIAQGNPDGAQRLLTKPFEDALAGGFTGHMIEVLIVQALAFQEGAELDQALIILERALSLAEPEGYTRVFLDEGPPMAQLLRGALARGITVGYANKLLTALEEELRDKRRTISSPASDLVEPLSQRESEVLDFLSTHLSSTEIAQELFISVNTVRSHIKSVYSKLNVHGRNDAIQRARELGLL